MTDIAVKREIDKGATAFRGSEERAFHHWSTCAFTPTV